MKNKRNLAWIAPVVFALMCIVYLAQSGSVVIVASVTMPASKTDSNVYSSAVTIDRDSLYQWSWLASGTICAALKMQTSFMGSWGDSLTIDSINITASSAERLISTITGDSLMNRAWRQWTSYSASVRTSYKTALPGEFKYRLFWVIYNSSGTPTMTVHRFYL